MECIIIRIIKFFWKDSSKPKITVIPRKYSGISKRSIQQMLEVVPTNMKPEWMFSNELL